MTQRDKAYETRDRSRNTYFSTCEAVESARQKRASAKEGRDTDKASRAYDAACAEMLLAKDQYLVDLDVANMAKRRVYEVHLPHLIDEFQQLEASGVKQLEDLVGRMLEIQADSGRKVLQAVEKAKEALALVNVAHDQQRFVDLHATTLTAAYEHPPDLVFEECPVWHDTVSKGLSYIRSNARRVHELTGVSRLRLAGRLFDDAGSGRLPPEPQVESATETERDLARDRDEAEGGRLVAELEGHVRGVERPRRHGRRRRGQSARALGCCCGSCGSTV